MSTLSELQDELDELLEVQDELENEVCAAEDELAVAEDRCNRVSGQVLALKQRIYKVTVTRK